MKYEAIRACFRRPNVKWITRPPMFGEAGSSIEENIKSAEATFRQLRDRNPFES
ncbi:MAG TPA: hypothetical protein VL134_03190 [Leptolyngbya sp.]|jgi:hypothetical protein|nr:hypothetical protein [Leptolyngbya sp.]